MTAAALVVAFLALPAPLRHSLATADRYWGRTPACATLTVTIAATSADAMGEAPAPGCWVKIAPAALKLPSRFLCAVTVHEWGHTLGLLHSTDPTDVMYPTVGERDIPGACRVQERVEWEQASMRLSTHPLHPIRH